MILALLGGLAALAAGGELLIRSFTRLAEDLGVSRPFIGLTVVAFGTSAPEAVVSVVAALEGSSDLALGNVVGSNIFNILGVLGISAVLAPAGVQVSPALLAFDLPVMVAVALLCLPIFIKMTVFRWEGVLLLVYFVIYTTYILMRATEHDALHGFEGIIAWIVMPVTLGTLLIAASFNLAKRLNRGSVQ